MSYIRKPMGATETPSIDVGKVAGVALVYHGYKRTGSLVWALLYGIVGNKVPAVAVPVAIAQGFGKKKTCTTE